MSTITYVAPGRVFLPAGLESGPGAGIATAAAGSSAFGAGFLVLGTHLGPGSRKTILAAL